MVEVARWVVIASCVWCQGVGYVAVCMASRVSGVSCGFGQRRGIMWLWEGGIQLFAVVLALLNLLMLARYPQVCGLSAGWEKVHGE